MAKQPHDKRGERRTGGSRDPRGKGARRDDDRKGRDHGRDKRDGRDDRRAHGKGRDRSGPRPERGPRGDFTPPPQGPYVPCDLPKVAMKAARSGQHPWVFRRMLQGPYAELPPGALVELVARDGSYIGRGFYNQHSEIAVRLLTTRGDEIPDLAWFKKRIAQAVTLRHHVLKLNRSTNAYRVVHSEGDGLSGLVVDRFGDVIVIELFSAGMFECLNWVGEALAEHFPQAEFVVRADTRSERHEGVEMRVDQDVSDLSNVVIHENDVKYHVDLREGHKTGFFVDQRDNRTRMADWCRGEDLFDGFCYTGGFGLSAARAGARSVECVDLDEKAIAVATKNARLNRMDEKLRLRHGNVFNVLREYHATGTRFARMVLDPAKMAVSRNEIPKALRGYQDVNRLGMQCLKPGGVLLTCSCTGLVSEEEFLIALRGAAGEAGVELQILQVSGAGADHPWAARMPEGRYLKAVFARVLPLP